MRSLAPPWPRAFTIWSERWHAPDERLRSVEASLRAAGTVVLRGGDYDPWDLEVRGGMFGAARLCMALEDHDAGKQLVRFRTWPICAPMGILLTLVFSALSTGAALDHAWLACAALGVGSLLLILFMLLECAAASAAVSSALRRMEEKLADGAMAVQDQQDTGPAEALFSQGRRKAVGSKVE